MNNNEIQQIVRDYIDKSLTMSLATVVGDKPWQTELHFVYDADLNLYWRSLASRRHSQEIAINYNVAGNIVQQHKLEDSPHAIYFEGTAQVIDDEDELRNIYPLFKNRLSADESIIAEALTEEGHKFYKVIIENWYAFGNFGQDKSNKYHLAWKGNKT